MNKKLFKRSVTLFGIASAAALVGCSDGGSSVNANSASSEKEIVAGNVVDVSANSASARLALCTRDVEHFWNVGDSTSSDTLSVVVDESFIENSFAVEADAVIEDPQGYMTLASAGVDGDQDAWALRIEDGKPIFAWRDQSTGGEWYKLDADVELRLGELITVRAERIDSLSVLYVDGQIVAAVVSNSEIKSIEGRFTIGFDPSAVTDNIPGRVMFVRFEKVRDMKVVEPETSDTVVATPEHSWNVGFESEATGETKWIATWEFNDEAAAGRDFTGNGHDATVSGSVEISDTVATFDGASGMKIALANDMKIDNFVVEARVKPSKFATMQNILVAEPPGRYGDGWMLRVDEGTLRVHFRDEESSYTDWTVFAGKDLVLNEWNEIRFERFGDSLKLFQNGELTVAEVYQGSTAQMTYDWGLGYDAMDQAYNTRFFEGEMDYVRFGSLESLSAGSVQQISPYYLLADWEFNDPAFPGLDKMANNTCKYMNGAASIVDGALSLNGNSGMPVSLTSTFKRNEFMLETRIKPVAFSAMQNVFVAEPPGRYGDGWMVRVDDGVLKVQLRDEVAHGTEWQTFSGKALELNEWTEVRVVRTEGSIKVYQNDELTIDAACGGDVGQLGYGIGVGFDAVFQRNHDRYFVGDIDYVRYYGIRK